MTEFELWLETAGMMLERKKAIALMRESGATLRAVGDAFDLSPERVRQIHFQAIRHFNSRHHVAARLAEKDRQSKEYAEKYQAHLAAGVISIDELELGVRARNALRNERILTVDAIPKISDEQFLRTTNVGRKTLKEIRRVVEDFKQRYPHCFE